MIKMDKTKELMLNLIEMQSELIETLVKEKEALIKRIESLNLQLTLVREKEFTFPNKPIIPKWDPQVRAIWGAGE